MLVGTLRSLPEDLHHLSLLSCFPHLPDLQAMPAVAVARKVVYPNSGLVLTAGDTIVSTSRVNEEILHKIRRILSVSVCNAHAVVIEGDSHIQAGVHRVTGCTALVPDRVNKQVPEKSIEKVHSVAITRSICWSSPPLFAH